MWNNEINRFRNSDTLKKMEKMSKKWKKLDTGKYDRKIVKLKSRKHLETYRKMFNMITKKI